MEIALMLMNALMVRFVGQTVFSTSKFYLNLFVSRLELISPSEFNYYQLGTHECDENAKCVNIIPVFVTNDGHRTVIGTVEEVIERFAEIQARFTISLRDS